jgi:phospholipid:diacylglycerol acyltransferase
LSAITSGEMKDTSNLIMHHTIDSIFTKEQRTKLFRSWGSLSHMLPRGNSEIWKKPIIQYEHKNITVESMNQHLKHHLNDSDYLKFLSDNINIGMEPTNTRKDWSNPLLVKLPMAPSMKIHCAHGNGKMTEIGYLYSSETNEMNVTKSDEKENLNNGVFEDDGDGTVPTVSLDYMCGEKGWKNNLKLNPSNMTIMTRKYRHDSSVYNLEENKIQLRSTSSSDHIDIVINFTL